MRHAISLTNLRTCQRAAHGMHPRNDRTAGALLGRLDMVIRNKNEKEHQEGTQ